MLFFLPMINRGQLRKLFLYATITVGAPVVAITLAPGGFGFTDLFSDYRMNAQNDPDSPTLPLHLQGIDTKSENWRDKNDAYWKAVLDPARYQVCRQAGTERAFSGAYCLSKSPGAYRCYCCGALLFSATTKFDSGSGWPSFTQTATPGAIRYLRDTSHGMERVETRCARCDAHLGHVFDDGPPPTGKRYCINSLCLFQEQERGQEIAR